MTRLTAVRGGRRYAPADSLGVDGSPLNAAAEESPASVVVGVAIAVTDSADLLGEVDGRWVRWMRRRWCVTRGPRFVPAQEPFHADTRITLPNPHRWIEDKSLRRI